MDDYWKNLYDTVSRTPGISLQEQVGKTLNGKALSEDQVGLIVLSATEALKLEQQDVLVDLCCGNGLITEHLAPLADRAWGIDFSEGLIEVARQNSRTKKIEYAQGDVLKLDGKYFSGVRKVLMNESLQHFSSEEFGVLLECMASLEAGSRVYFGGIPDLDKFETYYDTPEKLAFYQRREREGRPHSGTWWSQPEIVRIAKEHGFKPTVVAQKPSMVTSYYRFDLLLEK